MSSSDIFAEPMLDTEDYLEEYRQQLNELDKEGQEYKVYSFLGGKFGAHKSIVLTTDDEHFVTVELGFREVNDKKHIYPVTRSIDKSAKAKMEYHGVIQATGQELIGKAVTAMKLCKNCQDYYNIYLKVIGLKHARKLTDRDKVTVAVIVATIAIVVAAFASFLFAAVR